MDPHLSLRVRRHVVDIDLDVPADPERPVTVLFGPSGAGKTTILRCLAGLDRPDRGSRITLGGQVWDADGTHLPARARQVGYLFQDHALFPHLSVAANVAYGLHELPREQRPARVRDALRTAGAEHLIDRHVRGLSGGEAQRVALARAIAPRPRLLLLDEPLSALDAPTRRRLRTDLRQRILAAGIPTFVVTHDRGEALALGDRVAVLVEGRLRQFGDVADVFARPIAAEVAEVLDMESVAVGTVLSTGDGVNLVRVGQTELTGVCEQPLERGAQVLICMRAENIAIDTATATATGSTRNDLPATVISLTPEPPVIRVDLDAGFPLSAFITRPAAEDLDLQPGHQVRVRIKASAVHLIPRRPTGPDPTPPDHPLPPTRRRHGRADVAPPGPSSPAPPWACSAARSASAVPSSGCLCCCWSSGSWPCTPSS